MDDYTLEQLADVERPKKLSENYQDILAGDLPDLEKEVATESTMEKSAAQSDNSYGRVLAKVQSANPTGSALADISQDASEAHQKPDREQQIEHLVELTISKGLDHAVATAEHLGDYYMLDQLHDRLLHDELHEKLIQSGVLRKE